MDCAGRTGEASSVKPARQRIAAAIERRLREAEGSRPEADDEIRVSFTGPLLRGRLATATISPDSSSRARLGGMDIQVDVEGTEWVENQERVSALRADSRSFDCASRDETARGSAQDDNFYLIQSVTSYLYADTT
jgi:hypothetical protein